jgi:hypothetical protein
MEEKKRKYMKAYNGTCITQKEIKDGFGEMYALLQEVDAFLKTRNAGLVGKMTLAPGGEFHVGAKVHISLQIRAYPPDNA